MVKRLKIVEKDALTDWEEFRKGLLNAATIDDTETIPEQRQRIAHLEADNEAWFAYYFPTYYTCEPAPFHKKATKRLFQHRRWYEVRAWSRELAKSSRSMMEVTKLALTGQIKNILLISNSQDNAERLLMPIMISFESNLRITHDYGVQQKPGSWEVGEFTTLNGVSFRALGAGQSPRGTRNEAVRPDFILIDDIDTDEETRNPDRIQKKWEWIEQALIPTVSVSGSYRILFNGNVIARDCCITRAMKKANFVDIVNIRNSEGKSSWPQKNSEEDIDMILSMISTASAQKEYFNNPISEGDVFKEMTWGKVPPLNRFQFLVTYGDPAPSNSKNGKGSYKSVFLLGMLDGKYYIITGFLDHVTNDEFVGWYYAINDYVKGKTNIYNFIENNKLQDPFYQQVFIPLFEEHAKTKGFVGIIPDERDKTDKYSRIEGKLEPLNRLGKLIFNIDEDGNHHMKRLEEQFLLVTPKLTAPADGPDCVEGAIWKINEKLSTLAADSYTIGKRRVNSKRI